MSRVTLDSTGVIFTLDDNNKKTPKSKLRSITDFDMKRVVINSKLIPNRQANTGYWTTVGYLEEDNHTVTAIDLVIPVVSDMRLRKIQNPDDKDVFALSGRLDENDEDYGKDIIDFFKRFHERLCFLFSVHPEFLKGNSKFKKRGISEEDKLRIISEDILPLDKIIYQHLEDKDDPSSDPTGIYTLSLKIEPLNEIKTSNGSYYVGSQFKRHNKLIDHMKFIKKSLSGIISIKLASYIPIPQTKEKIYPRLAVKLFDILSVKNIESSGEESLMKFVDKKTLGLLNKLKIEDAQNDEDDDDDDIDDNEEEDYGEEEPLEEEEY